MFGRITRGVSRLTFAMFENMAGRQLQSNVMIGISATTFLTLQDKPCILHSSGRSSTGELSSLSFIALSVDVLRVLWRQALLVVRRGCCPQMSSPGVNSTN